MGRFMLKMLALRRCSRNAEVQPVGQRGGYIPCVLQVVPECLERVLPAGGHSLLSDQPPVLRHFPTPSGDCDQGAVKQSFSHGISHFFARSWAFCPVEGFAIQVPLLNSCFIAHMQSIFLFDAGSLQYALRRKLNPFYLM